jgi:hypothetical protein
MEYATANRANTETQTTGKTKRLRTGKTITRSRELDNGTT